jgi:hypothetical protein
MNRIKYIAAALSVAVLLLVSPLCQATTQVLFNGVGGTSVFDSFALAAGGTTATPGGVCGNGAKGGGNWTFKSGASGVDNRSVSIAAVSGNVWIVWNAAAAAGTSGGLVCAYLAVDAITGDRLFYAQPRGTLSIPSSEIGEAGGNLVPFLPPDTALPSTIYNDLNNVVFNAAPTDLRPEDAAYATTRALDSYTVSGSGLGYGPGPIGGSILSEFSSKSAQVVAFNISGTDPITGQTIPAATTTDVGGEVEVVLLNTTLGGAGSGNFGDPAFNNVDRFVLANFLNGDFTRTRDMIPSSGEPAVPVHVLLRDPLSAAANVIEFCVTRSVEVNSTQELNVDPADPNTNPLNLTAADGGTRQRTGSSSEEVSEIGDIANSLGYVLFSFGNVSPIVSTARYVTVDGIDPLYASYTSGALPTCTVPCPGEVTYPNLINGSYPIWSIITVVSAKPVPAGITSIITAAQTQVANIPDFVPFSSLEVFRSHYTQDGVAPNNGHTRTAESGGDMGGAVFTIQADLDNITDTGEQLVNKKQ